jgi:phage-Barnase-EndoU-ColicinE5/D-RelE like nuclease2
MHKFPCPYLKGEVELTEEREAHIAETHPDILPEYLPQIEQTLADPDEVRRSVRMSGARMFYRWFEDVRHGKYVAVVVVSDAAPTERNWIITAYMTSRLINGEIEWQKS